MWVRGFMVASGVLALAGLSGVVAGDMALRNIGIIGYVLFGLACVALAATTVHASVDDAWLDLDGPATDEITGVPCVRDIAGLPRQVDLFVVAVGAAQVPAVANPGSVSPPATRWDTTWGTIPGVSVSS